MLRAGSLAALSVALIGLASTAEANVIKFNAVLSELHEATHLSPPSPATGHVEADFDLTAHTLTMTFDFKDLVGVTTNAHIHCCTTVPGVVGGAVVATRNPIVLAGDPFLGVHSGSFTFVLDLHNINDWNRQAGNFLDLFGGNFDTATDALIAGAQAGKAYFNIHTAAPGVPGGEINGFLVQTPEPSTIAMFGFGLLGLGFMLRKRVQTA